MAPRTKPVKSVLSIKDHGVLSSLLPLYKAAPLIGVQFIVEVLAGDEDPEYHCLLCKFKSGPSELMFHLLSAEHRLCYLVSSEWSHLILITFFMHAYFKNVHTLIYLIVGCTLSKPFLG